MLFLSHPDFAFLVWCLQFLVRVVQNLRSSCSARSGARRVFLCLPDPPCALYSKDLGAMCNCATASAGGNLVSSGSILSKKDSSRSTALYPGGVESANGSYGAMTIRHACSAGIRFYPLTAHQLQERLFRQYRSNSGGRIASLSGSA